VIVTATNVRPEPVWVSLPNNMGLGYVFAFTYGTFDWIVEPRWAFRAGESRSLAFDFQLPNAGAVDTLWGLFGRAHSQPMPIRVAP